MKHYTDYVLNCKCSEFLRLGDSGLVCPNLACNQQKIVPLERDMELHFRRNYPRQVIREDEPEECD